MPAAALPPDESERLAALHAHRVLDSPPERAFDDLTRQAMTVCETPVGLVSLVDEKRQWFKSRFGVSTCETPRDQSFCAHALLTPGEPLIVPDAAADPRFADNPLVTGPPGIRFYAGVPLRSPEGHALGTLCVIDHVPRRLSASQIDKLRTVAQQIAIRLSLRRRAPAERKLAGGFGLGFALLLGMTAFTAWQANRFLASDQWVAHTHEVIRNIEQTLLEVQAVEGAQRGYTFSGQDGFLPLYREALTSLPSHLAALSRLTSDNAAQRHNFDEFKAAIDAKLAVTDERIEQRRVLGEAAREPRYIDGRSRQTMAAVVAAGQKMIGLENQLLVERAAAKASGLHGTVAAQIITSVVGTMLLALGFWLVRRELRRNHALGGALAHANAGLEAEVAERRRAQGLLGAQHAVARIAAEEVSLPQAAPRFLRGICEHLDWQVGELWTMHPADGMLRLGERWHQDTGPAQESVRLAGFMEESRQWTFARGAGLPGRAWETERAIWEHDLAASPLFLRTGAAQRAGLHRAFAFPLRGGDAGEVNSVMVFLGREPGTPGPELIDTMDTLAGQVTQFAERCRAEAGLRASQTRFTAFIEDAPTVAYIKDEEGRFLYGNRTLLRRFGLSREEWLGKTDFDLWPQAAVALREHDHRVLAGDRPVELRESVDMPDGSKSHWLSYKFPLREEASGRKLLAGMSVDITEREQAEQALREAREAALLALREKETLLQEVHHRVKNNLQIIGSLLSMQARRTKSPVALAALGESASRVRSIALVHEKLYGATDLERVDAADYLRTLSRNLMDALGAERLRPGGRVALDYALEEGHQLDASAAIACGLIVNEALTNSFKHGFPDGRDGRVRLGLRHLHDRPDPAADGPAAASGDGDQDGDAPVATRWLRLEVCDDGVGLPAEAFAPARMAETARRSLGMRLVRDLTKQVGGSFEFVPAAGEPRTGLALHVTFPVKARRGHPPVPVAAG